MAEARNSFIKSKMNKDLDARIVPPGEYRDAQNVSVSKSEGADVGSLENILGNISLTNFGLSATTNLDIIGFFMDVNNDRIFVFMTNYVDTSSDKLSNFAPSAATCNIGVYNILTSTATVIVNGYFLNFSKCSPILGVNLIDNNLFFSDNRNQPRKINVTTALNDTSYYNSEDKISLPKYYPYEPIALVISEVVGGTITAGAGYTPGTQTNLSTTGGTGSGLTVDATFNGVGAFTSFTINNPGQGYTNGDVVDLNVRTGSGAGAQITLIVEATSTMKDVVSPKLPDGTTDNPWYNANWPGDKEFLKEKFVRFAYRFKFVDGEYSLISPFTQECFVPEQDGYFVGDDEKTTFKSTEVEFMKNKINDINLVLPVPGESTNWGNAITDFNIDSVDIIYKDATSTTLKVLDTIQSADFTGSTFTQHIYNYQSRKPFRTLPTRDLLRVYDQTPVRALAQEVVGNRLVFGNIIDKHTPPETLNYNVSIGFKMEESGADSANQYSEIRKEYQNHSLKQDRTYQVGVVLSDRYGRQSDVILSNVETNSQTATQKGSTIFNAYKAGNADSLPDTGTTTNFSYFDTTLNSGVYPSGLTNNLLNSTDTWPGDQLKIRFNEAISSTKSSLTGLPGLYSTTNPVGWYSYKVVVKQDQTDYYNVYCPGVLNGYIDGETDNPLAASPQEPIFHFAIHSDNLSKLPKDVSLVGPNQNVFRTARPSFNEDPSYYQFTDTNGNLFQADPYSEEGEQLLKTRDRERDLDSGSQVQNASIRLATRVLNYYNGTATEARTRQYYPVQKKEIITTIGTGSDLGLFAVGNVTEFPFNTAPGFYNYQSNPFIARMSVYSVTSSVGIGEFGQVGPSPSAGQYKATATITTPGTNYPGTGGSGIPVVFDGTTSNDNLFKNKGIKIAIKVGATGPTTNTVTHVTITNPGDGWETIGLTSASPTKFATATIAAAGNGDAQFTFTITKSTYGPAAGLLPIFSVFETTPLESKLDIYWETSTSGKISDLNTSIIDNDFQTPYGYEDNGGVNGAITWSFPESNALTTTLMDINVVNYNSQPLNPVLSQTLISVTDALGNDVTSSFSIAYPDFAAAPERIQVKNAGYYFYGNSSAVKDLFTFVVRVVVKGNNYSVDGVTVTKDVTIQPSPSIGTTILFPLSNVAPTVVINTLGPNASGSTASGGTVVVSNVASNDTQVVALFDGRNGTNNSNTANLRTDLQYRLLNVSPALAADTYNITEDEVSTGQYNLNILKEALPYGLASMDIQVTDGGGLTATHTINVEPT